MLMKKIKKLYTEGIITSVPITDLLIRYYAGEKIDSLFPNLSTKNEMYDFMLNIDAPTDRTALGNSMVEIALIKISECTPLF